MFALYLGPWVVLYLFRVLVTPSFFWFGDPQLNLDLATVNGEGDNACLDVFSRWHEIDRYGNPYQRGFHGKKPPGNSAGDLLGMVKWPFQRLSDLQQGDKKVTLFESPVFLSLKW